MNKINEICFFVHALYIFTVIVSSIPKQIFYESYRIRFLFNHGINYANFFFFFKSYYPTNKRIDFLEINVINRVAGTELIQLCPTIPEKWKTHMMDLFDRHDAKLRVPAYDNSYWNFEIKTRDLPANTLN